MSGALTLYNSRTRRKEAFEPLEAGHARVYSCGPTVYAHQHLGNMRSVVFSDLLNRALRAEGLRVTHVMNITDVGHLVDDEHDAGEDKMEKAARLSGRSAQDIAKAYTQHWLEDRARLNCTEPDVLCLASEHIAEQIAMIERIEAAGAAYPAEDGLYFDVSTFPAYAELARLKLDAQKGGARVDVASGKRNPQDFALWKFSPPGARRQQEWDSPWGRGFPGWHIECSAMSVRYLGERFDIHTGGVEHLPVHHSNEVAQAETALGVHPWVQYWMHHDWILFEGEKMAKRAGGAPVLEELVKRGVPPLAYRYFLLQAHYRKQQHWSEKALQAAVAGYRRLLAHTLPLAESEGNENPEQTAPLRARFAEAVRDDLNAPQALALAGAVARDTRLSPASRRALLEAFDAFLGLDLLTAQAPGEEEGHELDAETAQQLEAREAARRAGDYAEADRIRALLEARGLLLEDTPEGPRVRRKPS